MTDYVRAVRLDPNAAEPRRLRGWLFHRLGRWAEAIADFETAIRLNPAFAPTLHDVLADARTRAAASPQPAWLAALDRANLAVQSGDYSAARSAFVEALEAFEAIPEAERVRLRTAPSSRGALIEAHYGLACVLSLASAGRSSPGAPAQEVAPTEAGRLRDEAFRHLNVAVHLGWKDSKHLVADADLEPIRADPRWAELLRDMSEEPR